MSDDPMERLLALRLHQRDGRRSPHKPLLALVALGRLISTGSSQLPWSVAEQQLGDLLAEFGRPTTTARPQSAAYPFTRLRSDGVWQLDADVPMDAVTPLKENGVTGRFAPDIEAELLRNPARALATARALAASHFPETLIADVLAATGLDPELVLGAGTGHIPEPAARQRSVHWRYAVIEAWDRQCAFCGYDGQLGGAPVGLESAHVRWWAFDGPDELDNGLALCALHHKLFDRGVLGLDDQLRVAVSTQFSARTPVGRMVYDLHGRALQARPGTVLPAIDHVVWHDREVFKGSALAA
jgi:putative restriction endonuclease